MKKIKYYTNKKGFAGVELIIALAVVIVIAVIGWYVLDSRSSDSLDESSTEQGIQDDNSNTINDINKEPSTHTGAADNFVSGIKSGSCEEAYRDSSRTFKELIDVNSFTADYCNTLNSFSNTSDFTLSKSTVFPADITQLDENSAEVIYDYELPYNPDKPNFELESELKLSLILEDGESWRLIGLEFDDNSDLL